MDPAMTKPELSDPIALRIPVEIPDQIDAVAGATERTPSWVIVHALKYHLGGEGGEIPAAIKGHRQIAGGKFRDMGDVIAEIDAIAGEKVA